MCVCVWVVDTLSIKLAPSVNWSSLKENDSEQSDRNGSGESGVSLVGVLSG